VTPTGKARRDDPHVKPAQASAWNIANALTILRIALVPVFGWLLLLEGGVSPTFRLLAAGVFLLATVTDSIDGDIARARGEVTDFGTVSDPIADKALMGMALVGLSIIGLLPWWVTVVVLVREVAITALRFLVIRHGVMPASRGGKVKTVLQSVAIMLYVLPLHQSWHLIAVVTMTLAVIVTVATGVDYVVRAHTLRNTSPRAQVKRERRAAASAAVEMAAREAAAGEVAPREDAARVAAREEAARGAAREEAAGVAAREDAARGAAREDAERVAAREEAARVVAREEAERVAAARHTAGPEV
jgi:CDP-diacylglycerol--glycerol-3-phosphate 3-phosphatidyltransferase